MVIAVAFILTAGSVISTAIGVSSSLNKVFQDYMSDTCNIGSEVAQTLYKEFNGEVPAAKWEEYFGEMKLDENMEWYCPNCGCRDHSKLNIARRTCGYIGTNL